MDFRTKDNLTDLFSMDDNSSSVNLMDHGQVTDKDDNIVTLGN